MKSEKGITLIALVITIIVMLILVAVTVAVAINGGLIGKAQEAKNRTQAEIEKEQLTSAVLGTLNDDGTVNFTRLESGNLPTGFTGANGIYTSSTGNKFKVAANGEVMQAGEPQLVSISELDDGDKITIKLKQNENITSITDEDSLWIDINDTIGIIQTSVMNTVEGVISNNYAQIGYTDGDFEPDISKGPFYLFFIEGTSVNITGEGDSTTVDKTGWYYTTDMQTIEFAGNNLPTYNGTITYMVYATEEAALLEQIMDIYKD